MPMPSSQQHHHQLQVNSTRPPHHPSSSSQHTLQHQMNHQNFSVNNSKHALAFPNLGLMNPPSSSLPLPLPTPTSTTNLTSTKFSASTSQITLLRSSASTPPKPQITPQPFNTTAFQSSGIPSNLTSSTNTKFGQSKSSIITFKSYSANNTPVAGKGRRLSSASMSGMNGGVNERYFSNAINYGHSHAGNGSGNGVVGSGNERRPSTSSSSGRSRVGSGGMFNALNSNSNINGIANSNTNSNTSTKPTIIKSTKIGPSSKLHKSGRTLSENTQQQHPHPQLTQQQKIPIPTPPDGIIFAQLRTAPHTLIVYRTKAARQSNPERLNLDRRKLSVMPVLEGEDDVRLVNYQNNRIDALRNLRCLRNLIFLDLFNNCITELSDELHYVPTLRVLMLGKNRITSINSNSLSKLHKLDVLDIHSNLLTSMQGLEHLTDLRVLNLCSNKISVVEHVDTLRSLIELNICDNVITEVRYRELNQLPVLQRLFMSNNCLDRIGDDKSDGKRCLFEVKGLVELSLSGNPICENADADGADLIVSNPPDTNSNDNDQLTATATAAPTAPSNTLYRAYITTNMKALQILDLKKITDDERKQAVQLRRTVEEKRKMKMRKIGLDGLGLSSGKSKSKLVDSSYDDNDGSNINFDISDSRTSPFKGNADVDNNSQVKSKQSKQDRNQDRYYNEPSGQSRAGYKVIFTSLNNSSNKDNSNSKDKNNNKPNTTTKGYYQIEAPTHSPDTDTDTSSSSSLSSSAALANSLQIYGKSPFTLIPDHFNPPQLKSCVEVIMRYVDVITITNKANVDAVKRCTPNAKRLILGVNSIKFLGQIDLLTVYFNDDEDSSSSSSVMDELVVLNEGNAVVQLKLFRFYCAHVLPKLKYLNGITVTAAERKKGERLFRSFDVDLIADVGRGGLFRSGGVGLSLLTNSNINVSNAEETEASASTNSQIQLAHLASTMIRETASLAIETSEAMKAFEKVWGKTMHEVVRRAVEEGADEEGTLRVCLKD